VAFCAAEISSPSQMFSFACHFASSSPPFRLAAALFLHEFLRSFSSMFRVSSQPPFFQKASHFISPMAVSLRYFRFFDSVFATSFQAFNEAAEIFRRRFDIFFFADRFSFFVRPDFSVFFILRLFSPLFQQFLRDYSSLFFHYAEYFVFFFDSFGFSPFSLFIFRFFACFQADIIFSFFFLPLPMSPRRLPPPSISSFAC
jgi:hypothetical protein